MLRDGLVRKPRRPLVRLHQDEEVVHADGEDEEGEDLEDDQIGHDAEEAEDADGGPHRQQHDQDSGDAEGYLVEISRKMDTYYFRKSLFLKTRDI